MKALKLSNQICFPLYVLSRQITALYRPHLEEIGLTYPQYLVMMVLWEREEVTVKQLGELLWLDSGTLTPLLKRMEERGWVKRNRCEEDERVVNISLTQQGKDLEQKAASIPYAMQCKLDIGDEQLATLRLQLQNLLAKTSEKQAL